MNIQKEIKAKKNACVQEDVYNSRARIKITRKLHTKREETTEPGEEKFPIRGDYKEVLKFYIILCSPFSSLQWNWKHRNERGSTVQGTFAPI